MSDETARALHPAAHRVAPHAARSTIAWQGGEPTLMGLEFFRRAVELGKKYARPGMTVIHTIQTNGTKIDGDWARFFKENGFLVGLSIDGPRELHDAYRRDKAGKPTFDKVMRGLAALREHDVEWNALTTVNAANEAHPAEVYRFLRDECGCEFIQLIPIVERPSENGVPVRRRGHGAVVSAHGLGPVPHRRLRRVGAARRRPGVRAAVRRRPRQLVRRAVRPLRPHRLLRHGAGHGVQRRRVRLRPLRRAGLPARQHPRAAPRGARRLGQRRSASATASSRALPRYCVDCDVRFACHGGCPKDRFVHVAGRTSRGSTTSAPATRTSSTTSTSRCGACATCCAQERAPADIVAEYRATE